MNDSNDSGVITVPIESIPIGYTPEYDIRDITLASKLEMPNPLIPVICSDPIVPNELECVVSIIVDQRIRYILKIFQSGWEDSHSRRR